MRCVGTELIGKKPGGWFFVVASEAITVGDTTVTLPGIGSYVALPSMRPCRRASRRHRSAR